MGGRRAESSIIEGNLAAAERTIASFYPATVCNFLVDLITLRFSWRSESVPEVETFFCPFFFFTSRSQDGEFFFSGADLQLEHVEI